MQLHRVESHTDATAVSCYAGPQAREAADGMFEAGFPITRVGEERIWTFTRLARGLCEGRERLWIGLSDFVAG